jgi:hypothetical protein
MYWIVPFLLVSLVILLCLASHAKKDENQQ